MYKKCGEMRFYRFFYLLNRRFEFEIWSMKKKEISDIIENTDVIIITFCISGLSGIHYAHFTLDGNGLFLF